MDMTEDEQRQRDQAREQALASLGHAYGVDSSGNLRGAKPQDDDYLRHGKVRIWDLSEGRYVDLNGVDAAERIAIGNAVLQKPES